MAAKGRGYFAGRVGFEYKAAFLSAACHCRGIQQQCLDELPNGRSGLEMLLTENPKPYDTEVCLAVDIIFSSACL
ncbi:hypothetical protein QC764_103753 [Podospora pseudoanserina]|uniref:Uncharacterized protein n=1 Tax=Podospora pseudoanserina TaxID=2609844 RepID=A0ABR0IM98_9PEZI|nr:hypothetical protein QC764_103753 [Podospora pseudoanserina]